MNILTTQSNYKKYNQKGDEASGFTFYNEHKLGKECR